MRHRCPTCGYEYEPWIEACPDCGTHLVDKADEVLKSGPQLDPNVDPQWTVVTNVPNAIIGSLIKSQLEDAGIPVLMNRSRSADIGEFVYNDYVPHDLRVPRDRYDEARSLVYSRPGSPDESSASTGNPYLPEDWNLIGGETVYKSAAMPEEKIIDIDHSEGWSVYRAPVEDPYTPQAEETVERPYSSLEPSETSFEEEDEEFYESSDEWTKPKKWVKVFYAILLFAISLPFLLQIFGWLLQR